MKRDYEPDAQYEHTFLTLKLEIGVGRDKEKEIRFEKPLSEVKDKLVEIIDIMVDRINHIPRADTQIANSEKSHLWEILKKDVIVINAKKDISKIIQENLEVTEKALSIYDEYLFLLKENSVIEEFLEKKQFQREELRIRINQFVQTIKQIKQKCPFEIRCNMFLIKTEELNNKLVEICEDAID